MSKFQTREKLYDEWLAQGSVGRPPELPIFRGYGLSAMVDPFSPWEFGVVIYPHIPEGQLPPRHFADLSPGTQLKIRRVAGALGDRMLDRVGEHNRSIDEPPVRRVVERVDGFALPDHAHLVLGLGERGADPLPKPDEDTLQWRWRQLEIGGPSLEQLTADLARIDQAFPPTRQAR